MRNAFFMAVVHVLIESYLAFDSERAAIPDFFQFFDEARYIHRTLAERHLRPKSAGVLFRRPVTILAMYGNNMRTDRFQRFEGIFGAIEDEVGWIKIEAKVIALHFIEKFEKCLVSC